jgi:mannose-6-phosphate isomerase-like protein (cupin superfamily)
MRAPCACTLAVLAMLAGCTAPPRTIVLASGPRPAAALLAAYPPDPQRNITPYLLEQSERTSSHLIWVRDGEQPHVHATHDLVVTVLAGHGTLWLRGTPAPMRAGDVAVIPAGTPHRFVNQGDEPAAALAVFAPPSDGSDNVPVAQ